MSKRKMLTTLASKPSKTRTGSDVSIEVDQGDKGDVEVTVTTSSLCLLISLFFHHHVQDKGWREGVAAFENRI
jgi:hypothetical protein